VKSNGALKSSKINKNAPNLDVLGTGILAIQRLSLGSATRRTWKIQAEVARWKY